MRVSVQTSRSRRLSRGLRLSPALFAAAAVFAIALAALGQADRSGGAAPAAPATSPASAEAPLVDAAPAVKADQGNAMLVWDLFKKGGPVMWVLAGCSVIALAIIFERLFALRKSQVIPPGFVEGLKGVWRDPRQDRARALGYCGANDSPMSRMVAAFIKRLPMGFTKAEKALEDAGGNEALKLRANMRFLYAIGSVATLLGLIGTIAGMIKAFMQTANAPATEGMDRAKMLSEGIYEAMVCTFGGLAVAVLVTVFYYFLVGRVEKLVSQINDELSSFSEQYGLHAESESELGVTAGLQGLH